MNSLLEQIILKQFKSNGKNCLTFPIITSNFNKNFNFEPEIILNSLKHLNSLDYSKRSIKRALDFIKTQIDNPEVIAYLRNRSVSREVRSRELSYLLENCQQAMVADFPVIRGDVAKSVIHGASIDDEYNNCDSSLRFGMALDYSTPVLFGIMFHELTHINLYELGLPSIGDTPKDTLELKSIHEFISDLGTLAMYAKLSRGDEEKLNRYIDNYYSFLNNTEGKIELDGFSFESHHAARTVLKDVLIEAKEQGVKLTELLPAMFDSSLQIARNNYSFSSNLEFVGFTNDLCRGLNRKTISSNGKEFKFIAHARTANNTNRILSSLQQYITTIDLPRIEIISNEEERSDRQTIPAWIGFKPELITANFTGV